MGDKLLDKQLEQLVLYSYTHIFQFCSGTHLSYLEIVFYPFKPYQTGPEQYLV